MTKFCIFGRLHNDTQKAHERFSKHRLTLAEYARERMNNRPQAAAQRMEQSDPLNNHARLVSRAAPRRRRPRPLGGALARRWPVLPAAMARASRPRLACRGRRRSRGACCAAPPCTPVCGRLAGGCAAPFAPLRPLRGLRARSPPGAACAPSRAVPRRARLRSRASPCASGALRVLVRRRPALALRAARGRWPGPRRVPRAARGDARYRARPFSRPALRPGGCAATLLRALRRHCATAAHARRRRAPVRKKVHFFVKIACPLPPMCYTGGRSESLTKIEERPPAKAAFSLLDNIGGNCRAAFFENRAFPELFAGA